MKLILYELLTVKLRLTDIVGLHQRNCRSHKLSVKASEIKNNEKQTKSIAGLVEISRVITKMKQKAEFYEFSHRRVHINPNRAIPIIVCAFSNTRNDELHDTVR